MENTQSYTSSLSERYPSKEMKYLFSPEMKENSGSHWQKRNRSWAFPSLTSRSQN